MVKMFQKQIDIIVFYDRIKPYIHINMLVFQSVITMNQTTGCERSHAVRYRRCMIIQSPDRIGALYA